MKNVDIRTISITPRYARGLELFHNHSNITRVVSKYLTDYITKQNAGRLTKLNVLDIGSGDGAVSKKFAVALKMAGYTVEGYYLNEPNADSLNKAVDLMRPIIGAKHIHPISTTFQSYISNVSSKVSFDSILASQSLYFVGSEYFAKILGLLSDGGAFIAILDTSANPLIKFTDFFSKERSLCAELFVDSMSRWQNPNYSIETIDLLAEMRLQKDFNLNEPSDDAKDLISFLFQRNYEGFTQGELAFVKDAIAKEVSEANIILLPMQAIIVRKRDHNKTARLCHLQ